MSDLENFLKVEPIAETTETAETTEATEAQPVADASTEEVVAKEETTDVKEEASSSEAEGDAKQETQANAETEALKAELARIRHQKRELEQQLKQPKEEQPKPDFWENPEGTLESVKEELRREILAERMNFSEQAARQKYDDFDSKLDVFAQMIEQNPMLSYQLNQSVDPAEFAYKTASNHLKMTEIGGDVDGYLQKQISEAVAKERAKWEQEHTQKIEAEIQKRMKVPASLSDARAAGGNSTPEWSGPAPLGSILATK